MDVVSLVSSPSSSSVESHISPVPLFHQVSLFLETEEKKVDPDTSGSPCILSIFQIIFIV